MELMGCRQALLGVQKEIWAIVTPVGTGMLSAIAGEASNSCELARSHMWLSKQKTGPGLDEHRGRLCAEIRSEAGIDVVRGGGLAAESYVYNFHNVRDTCRTVGVNIGALPGASGVCYRGRPTESDVHGLNDILHVRERAIALGIGRAGACARIGYIDGRTHVVDLVRNTEERIYTR